MTNFTHPRVHTLWFLLYSVQAMKIFKASLESLFSIVCIASLVAGAELVFFAVPLHAGWRRLIVWAEVMHVFISFNYFLVKQSVCTLNLGIFLFLDHVFLLNSVLITFLLSFRRVMLCPIGSLYLIFFTCEREWFLSSS